MKSELLLLMVHPQKGLTGRRLWNTFFTVTMVLLFSCSTPPKKVEPKKETPGLKLLNMARTGLPTALVASSTTAVVLFAPRSDTYSVHELPTLKRLAGGRLESVRAAAFGNNRTLTTIRDGGLCSLTDLASEKTTAIIASAGAGRLQAAALSPSARSGCYVSAGSELVLLDLAAGTSRKIPGVFHGTRLLAISDTPALVVVGQKEGGVRILEPETGKIRQIPAKGPLTSVAFNRKEMAIGTLYWEFSLFPNDKESPLANRQIDFNPVQSLAFANLAGVPFLAVGSGQVGGGRIRLYRTPACTNAEFDLKPDCDEIIHLNMVGRNLLGVSRDGLIAVWQDKAEPSASGVSNKAPVRP